jgi:glutathione reductase (NADPH)
MLRGVTRGVVTMNSNVDLIVIGTGAAAGSVAYKCRSAGWSVTVVDSRPFGGTCQLRGCDPKKVLVGGAELVDWNRRMHANGVPTAADLSIEWPDLMRFKRTFTDQVPEQNERSFVDAGIGVVHGRARFVDRTTLRVGDARLTARHVVIAGGARHATLNIPGEEQLTTSTQFLDLERLPERIIFVGGGYIAFEFAHVAARAGARVQIVHRGPRPLARFDPDLVDRLVQATRELGVEVHLQTEVQAVERRGERLLVNVSSNGQTRTIEADMAVHSAGRVPEIDDLDLEAGGVARQKNGVSVNEYLQSISNPAVYAAGDAVASGGFPLTPVAGMQGATVASNLLQGNHRAPDYRGIPSVVFTVPPLATVGLQEAEAREKGQRFNTNYQDTASWYSSRRVGLRHSGFKVLVEDGTERILGAHLLGVHAEEVINLFALAIRSDLRASDLKHLVYSYPTSASDVPYMV